jgi:exopolysaccharide biosynthesis protein
VQFAKKTVNGIPLYIVTLDLTDPETYLVVRLPKNAKEANSTTYTAGHENFDQFVKQYPAAAIVNGTFFSKDDQERVMGNMVSEGKMLKYSPWENYGTTLSLGPGDRPEMVTARAEGKPLWNEKWFSLTCGPRLLEHGEIWDDALLEGFTDSHVLGIGPRSAIGYPKSGDKLYLVTFLRGLDLRTEAKLMKGLGCYEAMNLDGGASKALSHNNKVIMEPGRGLTNVLVVYDSVHKAPPGVVSDWEQYQRWKASN